ncbi:MAG: GMC oxidoreductase [Myxococcota bacterium]
MTFDFDYLVIGSGFGGSVSAHRLTEKGYTVGVLEAGRRWRAEDFPRTTWRVRKFLWAPVLRCFGIMRMTFFRDAFVLSGAGVGGGSLVYANTLLVPPESFFEDAQWRDIQDWTKALSPHYEVALKMLGAVESPHLGETDLLLEETAREMGREDTFKRATVGIYFGEGPGRKHPDPFFGGRGPERAGCNLCAGCMVGCRFHAKNTLDKNYLWLAEQGGAEVIPSTTVTDLRPLPGGGFEVFTHRSGSPLLRLGKRRYTARHVVLSAGAIGSTRLLLACRERGSLTGLSQQLGNFVRTNSESILGVTAKARGVNYARGLAISAGFYPDDDTHIETVRYNRGSDMLSTLSTVMTDDGPAWRRLIQSVWIMAKQPLQTLRNSVPFGWARRTIILLVMQPVRSHMRFVFKRRWWAPWSRTLQTRNDGDERVKATIPIGNEVATRIAKRVGGQTRSVLTEVLFNVPTTAHIMGGCAIGSSRERGVVDGHCQVHGVDGLRVIDGSVIPANLGVNPSLTITALAEHAMAAIPAKAALKLEPKTLTQDPLNKERSEDVST